LKDGPQEVLTESLPDSKPDINQESLQESGRFGSWRNAIMPMRGYQLQMTF
jgi:hypothetical protein